MFSLSYIIGLFSDFLQEPKLGGANKRSLLEKNKKWAQLLEEAKETERLNLASLQKYEQFELERKKKRERANVVR
uniref:Vps72/YL1 N-terminal domain-containing protein n=1 Tax=Parascaris equorum TaxID=6256 RepID=A0A914R4R5_PAREQ